MNPLMLPANSAIKKLKFIAIGLFIIIMTLLITVAYFKTMVYIDNRENDIRNGAISQCEAQNQAEYNKNVEIQLKALVESQERKIKKMAEERKLALSRAQRANQRAVMLNKQIRRVRDVKENNCVGINSESVRLLNEQAVEYNKRFGDQGSAE